MTVVQVIKTLLFLLMTSSNYYLKVTYSFIFILKVLSVCKRIVDDGGSKKV